MGVSDAKVGLMLVGDMGGFHIGILPVSYVNRHEVLVLVKAPAFSSHPLYAFVYYTTFIAEYW